MSNCVGRGPSALLFPGVNNAVKTACVQYSFVLVLLPIVLFVPSLINGSDNPFGIFKLFFDTATLLEIKSFKDYKTFIFYQ